jgi:hypothetical protein
VHAEKKRSGILIPKSLPDFLGIGLISLELTSPAAFVGNVELVGNPNFIGNLNSELPT